MPQFERIRLPGQPVGFMPGAAPFSAPQYTGGNPGINPPTDATPGMSSILGFSGPVAPVFEAYRLARVISGTELFSASLASRKFLPEQNNPRNFLAMKNIGTGLIYIGFGQQANANAFLSLAADAFILFDTVVPQDDIFCSASATTAILSYGFSTIKA